MISMERVGAWARPTIMRRLRVLIAVAGVVAVAACGDNGDDETTAVPEDSSGSETEEGAALTGTHWTLDNLTFEEKSTDAPADVDPFVKIEDGQIGGNTGCNTFGGDVEVSEDSDVITVGEVMATKKACSGALGDIDSAMLKVLKGEVTAEIGGDQLTLTNADGGQLVLHADDEAGNGDNGDDQNGDDDAGEDNGGEDED